MEVTGDRRGVDSEVTLFKYNVSTILSPIAGMYRILQVKRLSIRSELNPVSVT